MPGSVRVLPIAGLLALAACGQAPSGEPSPGEAPERLAQGAPPAAFARCATCHSVEPGRNGIGPSLAGVFGAPAAHEPAFAYSQAMRRSGLTWDAATLDAFLADPRGLVPGTKMAFAGVRPAEDRAAIVEYLKGL